MGQADELVGRDHLLKRAMVLVKAWCYFESHILSSQVEPAARSVWPPLTAVWSPA